MTTTAPAAPRIERRSTFALFGLSATLTAGYGVLFTLVGDYRDEYGISETMVGLIIGVGFIVAFVAQTLLGPLGDRGHARTLIVIGSVSNVTGLLMMGFGTNAPVLLTGRIISGLAIGAAGGAAGAVYAKGRLIDQLDADVERSYNAALAALQARELEIKENRADVASAFIDSLGAPVRDAINQGLNGLDRMLADLPEDLLDPVLAQTVDFAHANKMIPWRQMLCL